MAENKILVQIIDHDDGDSVLGQDYFESREKAEEFKRIKVQYQTMDGKPRIKTFTSWTAQIIQHEIDHCDGILI